MKPLIGIIYRKELSPKGHIIDIIYKEINNAIIASGGIPIGITSDNFKDYLNICQGFILQGGTKIEKKNLEIIKLLYKENIPILGICQGMQEMAVSLGGKLKKIKNHNINTLHEIKIIKNTKLNYLLNTPKIMVNSRHKYAVNKTNLTISAISHDNIIEAIEDTNKTYFIGLEWHPENMYNVDSYQRKIFDYFIKICHD